MVKATKGSNPFSSAVVSFVACACALAALAVFVRGHHGSLYDDAFIYLQRVPGSIAVSDGHRMLEVPVTARIHQYDMEAIYATDVLRDVEETPPLRRRETPRLNAYAA